MMIIFRPSIAEHDVRHKVFQLREIRLPDGHPSRPMELQTQLFQPRTPFCAVEQTANEGIEHGLYSHLPQVAPLVVEGNVLQPWTNDWSVLGTHKRGHLEACEDHVIDVGLERHEGGETTEEPDPALYAGDS